MTLSPSYFPACDHPRGPTPPVRPQAISPLPSTRGEMTHFRRAEELWRKASKAREGSRRRTMGAAPTLEQRMAWRREQEEEEERARPPPPPPLHERKGQDRPNQPAAETGAAGTGGAGSRGTAGGGIGVPPPLPPGTQRAAGTAVDKGVGGGAGGSQGGVQSDECGGAVEVLDRATVRAKVSRPASRVLDSELAHV